MGELLKAGRTISGVIVRLAEGSGAIAALTILAMCLLITGAVLIRYLFNIPLVWVPEIVGYLMVALIFLSLGETMMAGRHIKIDLFVSRIPKRPRHVLELLTLILSTGIAGFFTWHGLKTMLRSLEYDRSDAFGALNTPLYIPQVALPVGLSILTLVLALLVCRKFYVVFYAAEEADADPDSPLKGHHQ